MNRNLTDEFPNTSGINREKYLQSIKWNLWTYEDVTSADDVENRPEPQKSFEQVSSKDVSVHSSNSSKHQNVNCISVKAHSNRQIDR
jgi:hypothetical protein